MSGQLVQSFLHHEPWWPLMYSSLKRIREIESNINPIVVCESRSRFPAKHAGESVSVRSQSRRPNSSQS